MVKMNNHWFSGFKAAVCLGLLVPPGQVGAEENASPALLEAFTRIEAYAQQTMEWAGTPGMALAVTSREQMLFATTLGCADMKRSRKVAPDTLFQIGSITKTFTALALLSLAEDGKIDLDEPVTSYLPWFSVHSQYGPITPRHLLTNTAGIPTNRDDLPSTPYMARALREQQAAWAPGTRFHYSNVGYQVLSVLVETVAAKSWQEVARERILEPLGMEDSVPAITYGNRERMAVGYVQSDGSSLAHRSARLAEAPFFEYAMGDGCVASTATDMAAFVRMLLNDGQAGEERIVSKASFSEFITPMVANDAGIGYALGILVRRDNGQFVLEHSGGMVGQSSIMVADMDSGIGFVIMANGPSQVYSLAEYALEVLRAAGHGQPLPEIPSNPVPAHIDNAGDYAGDYGLPGEEQLRISAEGSSLWVEAGGHKGQLERTGEDRFQSLLPGLKAWFLNFQRDEHGDVVAVTHGPSWLPNSRYQGPLEFDHPEEWKAYVGRYHSQSPWFPGFTVFIRQGRLWAVTAGGGETSAGDEFRLHPVEGGTFRPAPDPTPERVSFDEIIDGQAWQASWSGHRFYRARLYP